MQNQSSQKTQEGVEKVKGSEYFLNPVYILHVGLAVFF